MMIDPELQKMAAPKALNMGQMQSVLDRITYKPNWSFTMECWPWKDWETGQFLVVVTQTEDTYHPGESLNAVFKHQIPGYIKSEDEFIHFVKHAIYQAEIHEMEEFFKVDGKMGHNPHVNDPDMRDRELMNKVWGFQGYEKPVPPPPPDIQVYTWTAVRNDTLQQIAEKFYGDERQYRFLADMNGLDADDPDTVKPGDLITIVPLPADQNIGKDPESN